MNENIYHVDHKSKEFYFLYQKKNFKTGETGLKWHEHSFYEILFFTEGETEYVIENRCYHLKRGDVLFMKPGHHHFEHKIIKSPTSLFCLGFLPEAIESRRLAEEIFEKGEHLSLDEGSPVYKILTGAKEKLEGRGRVLLRESGTENVVRIMCECERVDECNSICEKIAEIIRIAGLGE